MKKILVPIVVTIMVIITLLPTIMAEENTEENTSSNIKISIKSKLMGIEKNWNTENVRINITIDRLGRLVYMENYYSQGGGGPKLYSTGRYYAINITNGSMSFNISRPRGGKKTYVFIQSIVILNDSVIFEQWLNLSNRTKLGNVKSPVKANKNSTINNKTSDIVLKARSKNVRSKNLSGTDNIDIIDDINKKNIVNKEMTKKSPGFGIITAITVISIVHIFKRSLIK